MHVSMQYGEIEVDITGRAFKIKIDMINPPCFISSSAFSGTDGIHTFSPSEIVNCR